ncbi:MAG: hypothetical protein JWO82_360 [Akkermansiaceae bacterium]|nr:hypothetical protein [Akkermansiaceae bacterium]
MALAESWHIRSRARSCSVTDRPFEDGETIVTALFPDPESSGYVRKDFSVQEWKNRDEEVIGKPFSFWKAVYHVPVAGEKKDAFRRESPEELLRRLVEEEEDHTENARYILAVMLERKKVLRETDTQRTPNGILRVYEHRKLGDVFIVRDPDIPLSEVERVQDEVMILLEQSSRGPVEDEPAEPAATAEGESAPENAPDAEIEPPPSSTEAKELPAEGVVEEEESAVKPAD